MGVGRTLELEAHLDCNGPPGVHGAHLGYVGPYGAWRPSWGGGRAAVGREEAARLWAASPALASPRGFLSLLGCSAFASIVQVHPRGAMQFRTRADLSALDPQTSADRGLGSQCPADRLVSRPPGPRASVCFLPRALTSRCSVSPPGDGEDHSGAQ